MRRPAHFRLRLTPAGVFWIGYLLALVVQLGELQATAGEVAIGVFAFQGERAANADWTPVIRYLNQAIPGQQFRLENHDAQSLRAAIAERRVDLVITNPGYYITMEAEFGLSRIATLESPGLPAAKTLGSVVFTRADRTDLTAIANLAGRRVAAVDPEAFGGYLLAAREMLRQGIHNHLALLIEQGENRVAALGRVAFRHLSFDSKDKCANQNLTKASGQAPD